MKYLLSVFLVVCSLSCLAQTTDRPAAPATPNLDMARLIAFDTNSVADPIRNYLLQQGWIFAGPVDKGDITSYWYDFGYYWDSTGRRRKDHYIYLDTYNSTKTIASIEYHTSSLQQYQALKQVLKQEGFRISIDTQYEDGKETQTFVKGPLWVVMVKDFQFPDHTFQHKVTHYTMTIDLLDR